MYINDKTKNKTECLKEYIGVLFDRKWDCA